MNKFFSLIMLASCLLLASCNKTAPNIFGTIPSVYENRMVKIAQTLREMNREGGIGAGNSYVMREAPLAYDSASVEALPLADAMIGLTVPSSIEPNLNFTFASDVRITEVELPSFTPSHSEPQKVTLEFDLKNVEAVGRLHYFLCGADDTIHCGLVDVPPVQESKLHVKAEIKAPNIPAEYQEKITTFRIVSETTYGRHLLNIQGRQKQWRAEYNTRLNDGKASLNVSE